MKYDIDLVGVGGQGILTIGEILAEAVRLKGVPVNFFPSKGMAQRGGFVKAQLRIGRDVVGPNIPEKGADLVIAMESSEALKAVRFSRPGGDFILFGDQWEPMSVILKKESYPVIDKIQAQIIQSKSHLFYINPPDLPLFKSKPISPNLYILGSALRLTPLGELVSKEDVTGVINKRWEKAAEINNFAFNTGYNAEIHPIMEIDS
jgi:indolepyruvate ferredoxin oxidoreductase, beta subunit